MSFSFLYDEATEMILPLTTDFIASQIVALETLQFALALKQLLSEEAISELIVLFYKSEMFSLLPAMFIFPLFLHLV